MKKRNLIVLMVMGVGMLWVAVASAAVNLRFTPMDTTVTPGESSRLSIFVDDLDANVRTIDVYVTYDESVVTSVGGGAGALYSESGFFVFQGIEDNVPGQWHGYAVVMGSTDFLEGPGELFYWDYQGQANGTTPVIAAEAYVAAGDGTYYPEVLLADTTINVFDPLSGVEDLPAAPNYLRAWPNPFNPRTALQVNLPEPGQVHLAVYDIKGYEMIVLQDGVVGSGSQIFHWDGTDSDGRPQPAGQYLVRLTTLGGVQTTKITMVK